jgi:hypothetical protein
MTNGNYTAVLPIIGKFAYAYFQASADQATQQQILEATISQTSKPDTLAALPATLLVAQAAAQWNQNINSGPVALQNTILSLATNYVTSADFISRVVSVPASKTVVGVMNAWAADMVTDSKTFTTNAGPGLIAFLNTLSPGTTIPPSGTPSYADSTYYVETIV